MMSQIKNATQQLSDYVAAVSRRIIMSIVNVPAREHIVVRKK